MNIQDRKTVLSDEGLASDQAVIDLMLLRVNESVALANGQRGLFNVSVVCVRCICGPGKVGDECLDAGEECRHFFPRAFV